MDSSGAGCDDDEGMIEEVGASESLPVICCGAIVPNCREKKPCDAKDLWHACVLYLQNPSVASGEKLFLRREDVDESGINHQDIFGLAIAHFAGLVDDDDDSTSTSSVGKLFTLTNLDMLEARQCDLLTVEHATLKAALEVFDREWKNRTRHAAPYYEASRAVSNFNTRTEMETTRRTENSPAVYDIEENTPSFTRKTASRDQATGFYVSHAFP